MRGRVGRGRLAGVELLRLRPDLTRPDLDSGSVRSGSALSYLAGGFAAVVLFAFFITFANMRSFGGAHYDLNGYLPKPVPILGRVVNFDANTTVFSIVTAILLLALISISHAEVCR
jgi:hypothetical protein